MRLHDVLREYITRLRPEQVHFNPHCRQAEPNQILIGVGTWGTLEQPLEHAGICLNNKDLARCFGLATDPATVTDLVLDPPPELAAHWSAVWDAATPLDRRLDAFTLVVEDAAPDSVLALLCWLARVNGVAAEEFRQPDIARWVEAARRWELTGMVAGDPHTSWAALLSALSHSYFAPEALDPRHTYDFAEAWRAALNFTAALLVQDSDPDAVLERWELDAYRRAAALLHHEEQDYQRSLPRSICLQLLMPVAGPEPRREVLADAYLTVETWPNGARKLFARGDRTHSFTGQGFAVMGVYRPDSRLKGTGDDQVVSVNPLTGLNLYDLWVELERLENERWAGQRPTENPRSIASYPSGTGYTQPWWDDQGRYTLLGAPRRLPDGQLGSRLEWTDVVNALWRVYNPIRHLHVEDALHGGPPVSLAACGRQAHRYDGGDYAITKYWLAMRWPRDAAQSGELLDLPSARRYLAALIARRDEPRPIAVEDLPMPDEFGVMPLHGGFAIVHDRGALVFDDWRPENFRLEQLGAEFERAFQLLGTVRDVERALDELFRERATGKNARPAAAVLGDLTFLRGRLTEAGHQAQSGSHWADVHAFRAALDSRWGLGDALKNLPARVAQLEDAIRTASTLETQRLAYILSTIGLPFFVSGALTGFLKPWLGEGWPQVGFYLSTAGVLIGLIHIALKRWLSSARERKQKLGKKVWRR